MIDDPNKPAWAAKFFMGMPAPAGAITVLLPIYVYFLGMPRVAFVAPVILVYTLAIAFLMVSRLPVFSGKRVGKRIAPEMVLPVFVAVVLFFALLVSYPWFVLTTGTVLYLACLPLGWFSYRDHHRKDAEAAKLADVPKPADAPAPALPRAQDVAPPPSPAHPPAAAADPAPDPDRPARLN
jgi:CDP-diacylglycerol--serine O-phosphatidyltransferase